MRPVVLIADDEKICLTLTTKMLEKLDVRVLCAHDGVEAVQLYAEHCDEIVLVLLDIQMPIMDGVEAFRRLKKMRDDIFVVFASGYVSTKKRQLINPLGPAGYITKPLSVEKLSFYLDQAIEQSRRNCDHSSTKNTTPNSSS